MSSNIYASYPIGGGGGSGSPGTSLAAGTSAIASGQNSVSVLYDLTIGSSIPPIFSFVNTTDASPIFLIGYVSAFSTTGFTVKFNANTDTANYVIVYAVMAAT